MRKLLTERNLVIFLFGAVLITFSFAENDTKKIEQLYSPTSSVNFYSPTQPIVQVIETSANFHSAN